MTSIAHLMLIAIHISSHILLLYFKQLIFVYFLTYSNSSRFSSNSEASASELLENLKEMCPCYF